MDGMRLLAEAREAGLTVEADGDVLRIRGPGRLGTLARRLLHHKPEVLAVLRSDRAPPAEQNRQNPPVLSTPPGAGRLGQPDVPERPGACDAPHELSLAERVECGYVNPGWTPAAWADRLRQLADRCEALRPKLAAQYRRWATNVLRNRRELM